MDISKLEDKGSLDFGSGLFSSSMSLAVYRNTGQVVVWKKVDIKSILANCKVQSRERSKLEKHLRHEEELLRSCDHPHIIKLFSYFEMPTNVLNLILESCPGGTLNLAIEQANGETFNESKVRKWLNDLAKALDYLHNIHDPQILHRNIKDEVSLIGLEIEVWE